MPSTQRRFLPVLPEHDLGPCATTGASVRRLQLIGRILAPQRRSTILQGQVALDRMCLCEDILEAGVSVDSCVLTSL